MKEENQNSYTIQSDEAIGQVQIADEVVAIIAGLAATEVEGVASMAGNITNELVSKLGMKKLSKGIKVSVDNGEVAVHRKGIFPFHLPHRYNALQRLQPLYWLLCACLLLV